MTTYDLVNGSNIIKLTNLISASSCTLSNVTYSNGIFIHSVSTTAMVTLSLPTPIAGHKYYGRCYQKAPAGSTFSDNRFEYYGADSAGQLMVFANMVDTNNEWKLASNILSVESPSGTWQLRSFTVNGTSTSYRKELMIIDLTEAFGSGKEPTKDWCDRNIIFFEGSMCVLNTIKTDDILNCPYSGQAVTLTVPKGKYKLEVWGGQGGTYSSYNGGAGGYSVGTLSLIENTILYLYAGEQPATISTTRTVVTGGFNGGGNGYNRYYKGTYTYGQGGGGASDIRIGSDSLYARVIVAGGGGGSASVDALTTKYGGGTSGGSPTTGYEGTQTSGGTSGNTGTFGQGGSVTTSGNNYKYSSGGGGGGWYGGAAASNYTDSSSTYRNYNGGGSGYIYTSDTASNYPSGCLLNSSYYLTDASTIAGNASMIDPETGNTVTGRSSHGYVRITVIEVDSLSGYVNIGNTWKEIASAYAFTTDWKEISIINSNINNTWKT